jgi:hypothetical protein
MSSGEVKYRFKVNYMTAASIPHVYCRVFVAHNGSTYASCGLLTMGKDEFKVFKAALENAEGFAFSEERS